MNELPKIHLDPHLLREYEKKRYERKIELIKQKRIAWKKQQ